MLGCGLVGTVGLGLVAFVVLFWIVSIFNGLVQLRNNIDKAWANINVLLKQRNDEIPNLVEIVKGYMKHEKEVIENVTKARTAMLSASSMGEKAAAHEKQSAALKTLFAVAEGYPQLKASDNFLALQKRISALENEIADRREFYNDSVNLYNIRIASLPDMFMAMPMGMQRKELFKILEAEAAVPSAKI